MKNEPKADPFAGWKAKLVDAVREAIKRAKKDGLEAIGIDCLRANVRVPAGGPSGTNAPYFFKNDWFPAAVASLSDRERRFILKGGAN